MPDPRQLDDQEAARRRRVWLDGRHRRNRDLVLVLLHYAPEPDVARALDQLPAGVLQRLAQLLTQATDLNQVARRIVADLQEQLDGRPAGRHPASLDRPRPGRRAYNPGDPGAARPA